MEQGLLAAFLALSTPTLASAQVEVFAGEETIDLGTSEEDSEALLDLLNTPVVTASGVEEDAATTPANVVSITREEIAQHGWRSLTELLSNTIGLYVIDDLVLPSVGVRGITGGLRAGTRVVKVMINSVPVNFRPDLTAFIGPEYMPMEAVERVEIAKGPLSALYGANAFLATVNVITQTPLKGARGQVAGRANVVRSNGAFGTSGMVTYGGEWASVLVAFTRDQADRSGLAVQRTFPEQNTTFPSYRRFFGSESVDDIAVRSGEYGQLVLDTEALGKLTLQGGIQEFDAVGEFQLNSVLTHKSRYAIRNYWSDLAHERWWTDELKTSASVGFSMGAPTRDEILFLTGNNDFSYKRNFDYRAFDGAIGAKYKLLADFSIDLGADFSLEDQTVLFYDQSFNVQRGERTPGESIPLVSSRDETDISIHNVGVSLQASGAPVEAVPNLRLAGNFRIDVPNFFDVQYSWRAAAAYRFTSNWVTKLIVGRAFQAPSGVMLFGLPGFGYSNNVVGSRTQPNLPRLEPQTLHSAEFVASGSLFDLVALEGSAYWQQLDDAIEFVQLSSNFVPRNLSSRKIVGGELTARFKMAQFSPYLSAGGQMDIVNDPETGKSELTTSPPALFPNFLALAGVTAVLPEYYISANAQARVSGRRGGSQSNVLLNNEVPYTLKPYAELDVTLSSIGLHLLGDTQETKILVQCRNLLDLRRSEPGFGGVDIPTIGRTVLVELRQFIE